MNSSTSSSTDLKLGREAHAGKMWLTARRDFETVQGPVTLNGYLPESLLATLTRWSQLGPVEQAALERRVTSEIWRGLDKTLIAIGEQLQAFFAVCEAEALATDIKATLPFWASGIVCLDDIEIDLSNRLHAARVAKRQAGLAAQVALVVRLADYPSLFEASKRQRRLIAVLGPTNSGKTYDAFQRLATADSGLYLGPLRLLALEAYTRLNKEFDVKTSLVTGEERRPVDGSTVVASTIEMLDTTKHVEVAVIDEIQMLSDPDRGWAWTQAVVGANADEVWVLGALSAEPAIRALAERLTLPLEVRYKTRKHPLVIGEPLANGPAGALEAAESGDAFIVFSRRDALNLRDDLLARKRTVACIYGALSPEVRENEAQRFSSGEADILVATDAIAFGLNLPIKRTVFTAISKFNGVERAELPVPLLQQIAGRAGRFGMDEADGKTVGVTPAEHAVVVRLMGEKQELLAADGFQIGAGSTYLNAMTELTGEKRLEALLSHFLHNVDCGDGFFKPHVPEEQLRRAAEVDEFKRLTLEDKLLFSMAPMSSQSGFLDRAWRDWVAAANSAQVIRLDFLSTNPALANLEEAEDSVRLLSAYRWFAHRSPKVFVDLERADKLLPTWTAVVDEHLKSKRQQGVGGGRNGMPAWYWSN
jgi:ATP-dependent RNA helicase SUPV3L1/SUV3